MQARRWIHATLGVASFWTAAAAQDEPAGGAAPPPDAFAGHPLNTWVKLSPLPGGPVSPRLGYEGACVWDRRHRLLVRFGGHNQGGGGEQGAELWTFDPVTAEWTLREPNTSPPGVCCNAQNIYDPVRGRYVRFPFFSGSHGWQWARELYLNDSTVWTYDAGENRWRNLRPLPAPRLAPYRCASWDSHEEKIVVFAGEGSREGTLVYDPRTNAWRHMHPEVEPPPRSGGNMAYDEARRLHVLFGTQFGEDPRTWTYDLPNNVWRDRDPPVSPPTQENDAVLTYDPVQRAVIALVKITTGEDEEARHEVQTWAYDAGENRWTPMRPSAEPDNAGSRTRNLMFSPEWNLALLENCPSEPREQQVWAYRMGPAEAGAAPELAPVEAPSIVEDAVVSVRSPARVELKWEPCANAAGYHVERAAVEVWTDDQLHRLKSRTPPLEETCVGAIRRIGSFHRLTREPVPDTHFADESVNLAEPASIQGDPVHDSALHEDHLDPEGRPYRYGVFAYRVIAVNSEGLESGVSPAFFTLPSSPQFVFSREDDVACRLRWAPNPELGIRGYRVYRMDGRWDKDPVSRLTLDPVVECAFIDEQAGEGSRRYYVVAVDALGQEGLPSSPVWHRREWGGFYEPFVGDWHQ